MHTQRRDGDVTGDDTVSIVLDTYEGTGEPAISFKLMRREQGWMDLFPVPRVRLSIGMGFGMQEPSERSMGGRRKSPYRRVR